MCWYSPCKFKSVREIWVFHSVYVEKFDFVRCYAVKSKFVPLHVLKTYRRSGSMTLPLLNLCSRCRWVAYSHTGMEALPFSRGLAGSQSLKVYFTENTVSLNHRNHGKCQVKTPSERTVTTQKLFKWCCHSHPLLLSQKLFDNRNYYNLL